MNNFGRQTPKGMISLLVMEVICGSSELYNDWGDNYL